MTPYQFPGKVSTSIFHGKKFTSSKLILSELETDQDLDSSKKKLQIFIKKTIVINCCQLSSIVINCQARVPALTY